MTRTCEDFERFISDRLDGPIPTERDRELDEHLKGCARCMQFLDSALEARKRIQSLPEFAGSNSILVEQRPNGFLKRRLSIPFPIAAAVALVAISGWLLAFGLFDSRKDTKSSTANLVHSVETIRVDAVPAVKSNDGNIDSNDTENML